MIGETIIMEYYLFLDETKPNPHGKYFGLGGYAISKEDYENILVPKLSKIKQENMLDSSLPLHLYDMRKNINGFEFLKDNTIRTTLYGKIKKLIQELDITVFVATIDVKKYQYMYHNKTNDVYEITLQTILENFVHFLIEKNATGSFFIESRNEKENKFLQICYYRLLTGGTLYINANTIIDRLSTLSFPLKSDNNLGVQLADFVPICFLKHLSNTKDYMGLYDIFKDKLYTGNQEMSERFGFKRLLE